MKKYKVIYADPPWPFSGGEVKSKSGLYVQHLQYSGINHAKNRYKSMTVKELCSLQIPSMETAALFMWTVSMHLPSALLLGEAWGFKYSTIAFVWIKRTSTNKLYTTRAPYTLPSSEICLLFTKGPILKQWMNHTTRQVVEDVRKGHSEKPPSVRDRIYSLLPGPRLEMFARDKARGWDVFGNQVKGSIKLKEK